MLALWKARDRYFVWDEWEYWTNRHWLFEAGNLVGFFLQPHTGHCLALPMAVWLPLDEIFGLKTYLPYVIPTIVVHCLAGLLLFELLCDADIRPAIAMGAACVGLFLPSAAGNVLLAWQICFVAPLALGYLSLLTIMRYADNGRASLAVISVVSVVAAIMSSGVGVTILVMAVTAAALRRRFGLAALDAIVAGGVYVLWRHVHRPPFFPVQRSFLGVYASYASAGIAGSVAE